MGVVCEMAEASPTCCSSFATCLSTTVQKSFTLIYTAGLAAVTIVLFLTAFYSLDESTTSQMIAKTTHRTRDVTTPNAYSMHPMYEDTHTRLYVCMLQAGINPATDKGEESIIDYKTRVNTDKGLNCETYSDGGWPRDYGFGKCITSKYSMTMAQTNIFYKCLDLSEGVMLGSVETPTLTIMWPGSLSLFPL